MPLDLPVIHDQDGTPRKLAALAPRDDFGGLPRFAAAAMLVPRDEWRPCSLASFAGDVWDQGQHGSCVGHGSGKAFEIAYRIAGGTMPIGGFSPTSLYSQINGGRDNGAVVSDAMNKLLDPDGGIGLMSEVPESVIYERQIPAAAKATRKRFRLSDAYHCDSFDAIISALLLGFPVSFGILIRSGFNRVGADGMVPTGGIVIGGHCCVAVGVVLLADGSYGVLVLNSWGSRWGKGGYCILTEWHFERGGQLDAFAVQAAMFDPMDPRPAPVARP